MTDTSHGGLYAMDGKPERLPSSATTSFGSLVPEAQFVVTVIFIKNLQMPCIDHVTCQAA